MSKKYMKQGLLSVALAAAALGSGSVLAAVPVVDLANLAVNTVSATANTATALKMHTVMDNTGKVVNINTNILSEMKQARELLEQIRNLEQDNYVITNNFNKVVDNSSTCNYCNYYGNGDGGEIPTAIASGLSRDVALMLGDQGYAGTFQNAASYQERLRSGAGLGDTSVMASHMQKRANDALVNTLSTHSSMLQRQESGLNDLLNSAATLQGRGNQAQFANALAGVQAAQLMQMREVMLASENARAAAAQADADRAARKAATTLSLRQGLKDPQLKSVAAK